MKKMIGYICTIGGVAGAIYTLNEYFSETKSFGIAGADVVVSKGDLTPVVISVAVMVIGIILVATSKK